MSLARPRSIPSSPPELCTGARTLVLPILAEIGWADGHLSLPERSAARGAALALGALDPLDARCGALLPHASSVDEALLRELPGFEREVLVACAAWMALADGVETPSETARVRSIAKRARLSRAAADRVIGTARWVRTVSSSHLTWRSEMLCLLHACASQQPAATRQGSAS